jgi:MtN3 and saliva related transmembrane protein
MMNWETIVGTIAATLSVVSFTPQAWRIIRTREVKGLSRLMYALTALGFTFWTAYGVMKGDWPIIVPNIICLALTLFIFVMLILPADKRDHVAEAIDPASN